MSMDDIKLFAKNEKELETLIQAGRKTRHANNEKWVTTHVERYGTTKSRKNQNARRKENLQILENIENRHH